MKRRIFLVSIFLLLIFFVIWFFLRPREYSFRAFASGKWFEIHAISIPLLVDMDRVAGEIREGIGKLDAWLSPLGEDSIIGLINRNAGIKKVKVPEEIFRFIKQASGIEKKMGGDCGFLRNLSNSRSEEEDLILFEDKREVLLKHSQVRLDVGGFENGFIVDQIVKMLRSNGVHNVLIRAGLDLHRVVGKRPGGAFRIKWSSGNMDFREREIMKDVAVFTGFERGFVLGPGALHVDAIGNMIKKGDCRVSTGVFDAFPEIKYYMVNERGEVVRSQGIEVYVRIE